MKSFLKILLLSVLMTGCGIRSVSEEDVLRLQIAKLQKENAQLKQQVEAFKGTPTDAADKKIDSNIALTNDLSKDTLNTKQLSYKQVNVMMHETDRFVLGSPLRDNEITYTNSTVGVGTSSYIYAVGFTNETYLNTFGLNCRENKKCTGFKPLSISNFNARIDALKNKTDIGRFHYVEVDSKSFLYSDTELTEIGPVREYITFVSGVQITLYVKNATIGSHDIIKGLIFSESAMTPTTTSTQ